MAPIILPCYSSCQTEKVVFNPRNTIFLGGSNKYLDKFLNGYVPNIFRECWQVNKLTYPCGCPFQSASPGIIDPLHYYEPNLIKLINIKSLFYFGVQTPNTNIYESK